MKLLCGIFAILFVAIIAVKSRSNDELDEFIIKTTSICQNETKASDEDVDVAKHILFYGKTNVGVTNAVKCLTACAMTKIGIMDTSNKLVPDKLGEMVPDDNTWKSKDGKTLTAISKEIGQECKSLTDPDKCEAAYKIGTCLERVGKKYML